MIYWINLLLIIIKYNKINNILLNKIINKSFLLTLLKKGQRLN
jgi:hypothetical protein